MDISNNTLSPDQGISVSPKFVERNEILQQALTALARIKRGRSEKSILLVGLQGTGKTVLLNEISKLAEEQQYPVVRINAHEKIKLLATLVPEIKRILYSLDLDGTISVKVKKAVGILKNFVSVLKMTLKIEDLDFGNGIESERGIADSGDLEADLSHLFVALGEAAQDRQTAIAMIIDDLQYVEEEEFSALIMAVHRVSQKSLPLVLIGAGLPQLVGKAGRLKSYAERLFDYPEIGPLNLNTAKNNFNLYR